MARLVVVDEAEWVLAMLADALRGAGHEVTTCTTADAGLAAVLGAPPDCVVCDVELPDHDGAWFVRAVRAARRPAGQTPILLVATQSADPARAEALQAGADAWVGKPYLIDEVLQQVDALLRMRARLAPARAPKVAAPPSAPPVSAIAGALAEVSVTTMLMVIESERRTGVFEVASGPTRATLSLVRGNVTGAMLGDADATPVDAVRAMLELQLEGGRFTFTPGPEVQGAAARGFRVSALLASAERPAERGAPGAAAIEVQERDMFEDETTVDIEPDLTSYRPPS